MKPEATDDSSKTGGLLSGATAPVMVLGLFGAVTLIIAGFSDVITIRVGNAARYSQSGVDRHGAALVLLALGGAGLTATALWTRRASLLLGVVVIAVAVLAIALGSDMPDINKTGFFGQGYENARADAGPGFWMELIGGGALLIAGLTGPLALRSRPRVPRAEPEHPAA